MYATKIIIQVHPPNFTLLKILYNLLKHMSFLFQNKNIKKITYSARKHLHKKRYKPVCVHQLLRHRNAKAIRLNHNASFKIKRTETLCLITILWCTDEIYPRKNLDIYSVPSFCLHHCLLDISIIRNTFVLKLRSSTNIKHL